MKISLEMKGKKNTQVLDNKEENENQSSKYDAGAHWGP